MRHKREMPWERADFVDRFTLLPWSVQFDRKLSATDKDVFESYAAQAFICGCNIVKLPNGVAAKMANVSTRSVIRSLPVLIARKHLEPMEQAKAGRVTVYKLTSKLFSSPDVIVSNQDGQAKITREQVEEFRKQFSKRRKAVASHLGERTA